MSNISIDTISRNNRARAYTQQNSMENTSPEATKRSIQEEESHAYKLSLLAKYNVLIKPAPSHTCPIPFDNHHRYKQYDQALIIKQDFDRVQVIDFLIANLYKVFLMLHMYDY